MADISERVTKADYVPNRTMPMRCVDDRPGKLEDSYGVQLPGGSEHLMDLILFALSKSGEENPGDDVLFNMVTNVLASNTARQNGIEPGLHIDDDHGHLDEDACADRVMGCGYDKVRSEVLTRMGVRVAYEPGERIAKGRALGWGVQVLTGEHSAQATAAVNLRKRTTLKTESLWSENRLPSFNHDVWVVALLAEEMSELLHQRNYGAAAKLLKVNVVSWSMEMYKQTLLILTNGRLGNELTMIE